MKKSIKLFDIEKLSKSKIFKEALKVNRRILKELKREFKNNLTSKEYKKVMWLIPDYNPINEYDAVAIGRKLILKYKLRNKMGGAI